MKGIFQRTELLYGKDKMKILSETKVIIFGIGGVGSWCAESLIRSGIYKLTIVDSDRICVTNINRQLQATCATVGQVKTEALKKHLLEINPKAEITTLRKIYKPENYQEFELDNYDFIIDAIDSVENKIHLIHTATNTKAVFFSALGAALKIDPTRIKVEKFNQVNGCHLGRLLRKKMRRQGYKVGDFLCVYSDELLENIETDHSCGTSQCLCPKMMSSENEHELFNHEWCSSKAVINGSLAHITAIYGFTLAGLVLQNIYKSS